MIGSPPFADNLSRIHLNELEDSELVNQLRDEEYHRGDAYGFTVEKVEDTLVSAYLLLTRPEVRQVFNEETQSVEEQEIQIVEKIPFRIEQLDRATVKSRAAPVPEWLPALFKSRPFQVR